MRPQAHPGTTAFLRPLAAGIPLAMQVIGHVYDVINYLGDFGYGEGLEVPVRCWSGNRHGLSGQQILEHGQEGKVVCTIIRAASGNPGDVRFLYSLGLAADYRRPGISRVYLRLDTPNQCQRRPGRST